MQPQTLKLFPQVKKLLKLALITPTTSCEAERSFSALRRLKTWLRASTTQKRLNHVAVCHVHRNMTLELCDEDIAKEFVQGNSARCRVFGD